MKVCPSCVLTVSVAGSQDVTESCLTDTVSSRRKIARRERATSVADSSAVATWYSSGWNWW